GLSPGWTAQSAAGAVPELNKSHDLVDDLEQIAHEPEVRDLEDRRLGVPVDGDYGARVLDAGEVLDRARDSNCHVQLRGDDLARLADLHLVGRVTGIHRGA